MVMSREEDQFIKFHNGRRKNLSLFKSEEQVVQCVREQGGRDIAQLINFIMTGEKITVFLNEQVVQCVREQGGGT